MRVGFNWGNSGQSIGLDSVRLSRPRVVLHRAEKCEENSCWNTLATVLSSRTITGRKEQKIRGNGHDKPYRALSALGLQHVKAIRKQDARRPRREALWL